ncbi:MAG TPA: hypothetical protein PK640_00910 [Verrucomicrobiota bacterium]|mgnify:CR=1 FL=1|nr:hypothetical protein [Verrucomicrobiota bacterium]
MIRDSGWNQVLAELDKENIEAQKAHAMSANAEIVIEEHNNVLLVAEAALVRDRDGGTSVHPNIVFLRC